MFLLLFRGHGPKRGSVAGDADFELKKIPFMIIVGEQEEESATISVRRHGGEDLGSLSVDAFSDLVTTEINSTLKSF